MPTSPSDLHPTTLQAQLPQQPCGNAIIYQQQVDSTNTIARTAARADHPEGLVVIAEHQQAGRGQYGRRWVDAPGQSLLVSLLLRPTWLAPQHAPTLINAFVAVLAEAIATCIQHPVAIKWPNDIVITDAGQRYKVAGVLCEGQTTATTMHSMVVGFGVNVHFQATAVVDGSDMTHRSRPLSHWYPAVTRPQVLVETLRRFDVVYRMLQHDPNAYQSQWLHLLGDITGQQMRIRQGSQVVVGSVQTINADGSLMMTTATGVVRVQSGILESE
jgi:BirA family biotin operon repressor/biotin-[acetyl-CoA-carboxylase] ligase